MKDIAKIGNKKEDPVDPSLPSLPDEDVTPFTLWLKNEMSSTVSKVTVSKRIKRVPAVLYGQISASMRMMMQMMDQGNAQQ